MSEWRSSRARRTVTGGVMHRRDFGDTKARCSPPIMQKDDSIRAIYNHNEKHQYYGRLHREQPADAQLRCAQPSV